MNLGIDIGGTNTKFMVVNGKSILHKNIIKTNIKSAKDLINDINAEFEKINNDYQINFVGVGCPGSVVDGKISSANLPFEKYPLESELSKVLKCPLKVENDANCAVLGEYEYSLRDKCNNVVMITIGTGIGGGIIIDKKLYRGKFKTGEFGHTVVQNNDGLPCRCGRYGCWEQYASATALSKQAEEKAKAFPESILHSVYIKEGRLDGKLLFKAIDEGCRVSADVFDDYLKWVALGIRNIANVFGPDRIIISGGITERGEDFINKIREYSDTKTPIGVAKLKNDAGAFGAAML